MSLASVKRNWEDMAELDALWGICGDPKAKYGKWDVDAFFKTGEKEIQQLMETCHQLGYPQERACVLDFGCGVGRLTRACAPHFAQCVGVDISEGMIRRAAEMNRAYANCSFQVNNGSDLAAFPDSRFDMIYSFIVLQHVPDKDTIKKYLAEFVRVLKPAGLLAFQLPTFLETRWRLQPGRRLYSLLRMLGLDKGYLYNKLGLVPNQMNFVPEKEVLELLKSAGGKVLRVEKDTRAGPGIPSNTYYCTK